MQIDIKSLTDLSEDDLIILKGLLATGSATPTDLAVRMGLISENLEPRLRKLQAKGLVSVTERPAGIEREIYRLSRTGQSLLAS
ncbi:MAG TPA: winged helix-turn-helix transcriptional regulator [Anaerolineae bacterium]|nr:winged helix-turn-helix transcriptional regulator [Anaerolineae bacterium]